MILHEEDTTIGAAASKAVEQKAEEINAMPAYKGQIETVLDRALLVNKRINKHHGTDFVNVLFIGEAGVGKSSRVRQWAKDNGINLLEVRAAGMDDTDLGGAISPSDDKATVKRLASTEFDALNRPNSVLFLDEYNRAPSSVRTNLLELINSHVVPDPREPSGQRKLENFLFTIAAINPASFNYDTNTLDTAELSRFKNVYLRGEAKATLNWLLKKFDNEIADSDDQEEILELKRKKELATALLTNPEFSFDSAEEVEKSISEGNGLTLSPRTFTLLLQDCDGTKEDFLSKYPEFCNKHKQKIVELILRNYKDIEDKANDALKSHDSKSNVFKKTVLNSDRLKASFADLDI